LNDDLIRAETDGEYEAFSSPFLESDEIHINQSNDKHLPANVQEALHNDNAQAFVVQEELQQQPTQFFFI
jgi:hypothetical protein